MEALVVLAIVALMAVLVARISQERRVAVRVPVRIERRRTTRRR